MILDGEHVEEGVSKNFVKVPCYSIPDLPAQYPGEEHGTWLLRLSHLHCQNQVDASIHTILRASPKLRT